jgi:hypothetical protein
MKRTAFGKGLGTAACQPVTLGQFRAITADLPDETPLTYNDDGRSDKMIGVTCASVERRVKIDGDGPTRLVVVFEA